MEDKFLIVRRLGRRYLKLHEVFYEPGLNGNIHRLLLVISSLFEISVDVRLAEYQLVQHLRDFGVSGVNRHEQALDSALS
jgi:hypothetical protein